MTLKEEYVDESRRLLYLGSISKTVRHQHYITLWAEVTQAVAYVVLTRN